jgi:TonB family protein
MSTLRGSIAAAAVAVIAFAGTASATSFDEAKRLYEAAAFENALQVLGELDSEVGGSEDVLEYKALCLLALGRSDEAQAVADALVTRLPIFVPLGEEVSPRFMMLLNDSRRRLLPDITKRLFTAGREQFRATDKIAARESFEMVIHLTDDSTWKDSSEAEDLRMLASGFLDLVNAPTKSADATPSLDAAPVPPLSPASIAAPMTARQKTELQPPLPIQQVFPKWRPADAVTAQRRFVGAVRIRIGQDGHVMSATIEVATDPDYDKQLLEAAKSWRYVPGRRNGEPIEMEKLVTFALRLY